MKTPQMVHQSSRVNGQMVHDSTYEYHRDSTIISYRPSVRTEVLPPATCHLPPKVDTIVIEHWRDRWRDHEVMKTDTVYQTQTITQTITAKTVPRFYKTCTILFWISLVLVVVSIIVYVVFRIYLHR